MGFGTELQGRESHDALLKIQDSEIKLLENIKLCLSKKIDGDRKYKSALDTFVKTAGQLETSEFAEYCSVFKAWTTVVKCTEKLAELFDSRLETISTLFTKKITELLQEKTAARKEYESERNRMEKDFSKIQDEVQKSKAEYTKCADRVRQDKAKYEDLNLKGKGASKLEDAKNKLHKSSIQLHKAHNRYFLSLCEVKSHQDNYRSRILPSFLDHHQTTQEHLVQQCKDLLQEYCKAVDLSSTEHQEVFSPMHTAVKEIIPSKEYTQEFTEKYSSPSCDPVNFEFDGKILDDYSGTLVANKLAVDTITIESLQHQKTDLEAAMESMKKEVEENEEKKKESMSRIQELKSNLKNLCPEDNKEYWLKKKAVEDIKKRQAELESLVAVKKDVFDNINKPLVKLGSRSPPEALDASMPSSPDTDGADRVSLTSSNSRVGIIGTMIKKKIFKSKSPDSEKEKDGEKGDYEPSQQTDHGMVSVEATGYEGNSKKLEDEDWFHGVLPREEVQRLLVNDGDYLVRESKNKKTNEVQYVLSVFWQGHRHFIIQFHEGGWRFEGPCFNTIPELVNHQHKSGTAVTNKSQAILKKAIHRESWELRNDDVALETKIGNGNFGEVFRGLYKPTNRVVAVKTCKDTLSEEQRKKFLQEGRILKQYCHPNIVEFIGIAAHRQPVMILMEYVEGGALLSFLRKDGKKQTKLQMTKMCVDAANGMAYLEEKGCIHRDLAARNCLVGNNSVVKISDFGMSREEEEYTVSDGLKQIPIKWTAPEALNYGKYTSLCDVWSYGILMWEVFSFGQTPYPGWPNAQAREQIELGYRMPAPPGTPDAVYAIMKQCWESDPKDRAHFQEIYQKLKQMTDNPNKYGL